jgi:hypothetical protein
MSSIHHTLFDEVILTFILNYCKVLRFDIFLVITLSRSHFMYIYFVITYSECEAMEGYLLNVRHYRHLRNDVME